MGELSVSPTSFQFIAPKPLDEQKIPTSLMPRGEESAFIPQKTRAYSSLSTIGSILLSPLMAIARLINAIAQSTMKRRPEGAPAAENTEAYSQFISNITKFEQSTFADRSSLEEAVTALFRDLETLPIPHLEKEACKAHIREQIDFLTFGMVHAQNRPQITFGSVNQFNVDPKSLACTFCASIWLARFLDPNLPTATSPELINEVILNGTHAYTLSNIRRFTAFEDVQETLKNLGIGKLPLDSVNLKHEKYFDKISVIGLNDPIGDYLALIEHHLDQEKGAIVTINGATFALARGRDHRWYMFDSHGGPFQSSAAFVASFETPQQLALFLAQTYSPRSTDFLAFVNAAAKTIHEMEDRTPQKIVDFLSLLFEKEMRNLFKPPLDEFANSNLLDNPENIAFLIRQIFATGSLQPTQDNQIAIHPVKFQRAEVEG